MEGDLQRIFGRNLRAYRKGRGLSQEEFAETLGVHRTYVGGVERGERNISLRGVERIAGHFGLEPRDLLSPDDAG
jgi:transcriptional regulator with XRE-family HTH domain